MGANGAKRSVNFCEFFSKILCCTWTVGCQNWTCSIFVILQSCNIPWLAVGHLTIFSLVCIFLAVIVQSTFGLVKKIEAGGSELCSKSESRSINFAFYQNYDVLDFKQKHKKIKVGTRKSKHFEDTIHPFIRYYKSKGKIVIFFCFFEGKYCIF